MVLGLILGVPRRNGRDKVTLITSPGICDLGAWLEQLMAESTGKDGKGIIPVDREPLGAPEVYGNDRVFAYIRLENGSDPAQDAAVDALAKAGHPVVRIALDRSLRPGPGDLPLGDSPRRWRARCSASTPSISRTSRRARSPPRS